MSEYSEANWHSLLGHLNVRAIRTMEQLGSVRGLVFNGREKHSAGNCEACMLGKIRRTNIPDART